MSRRPVLAVVPFALALLPALVPALTGTWKASLSLSGKSTYIGTVEFAAPKDSVVSGHMNLTVPVSVVAPLTGILRGDSVRLSGDYQAGNGCTGTISGTVRLADSAGVSLVKGPMTLNDKCAGAIPAMLRLAR